MSEAALHRERPLAFVLVWAIMAAGTTYSGTDSTVRHAAGKPARPRAAGHWRRFRAACRPDLRAGAHRRVPQKIAVPKEELSLPCDNVSSYSASTSTTRAARSTSTGYWANDAGLAAELCQFESCACSDATIGVAIVGTLGPCTAFGIAVNAPETGQICAVARFGDWRTAEP